MKKSKCYLFSAILIFVLVTPLRAQWVETNKPALGGNVMCFWVTDTSLIAGAGHGIYNTTDNGDTWTELLPWTKLEFVNAFVAAPTESASTILFAGGLGGVYMSTNGGTDWIAANSGLENKQVRSLAISSDESEVTITLFAGTTSGVFRSSDNGTSWTSSGLDSVDVYALTVTKDETGRSIILAGIEPKVGISSCIFRSTDEGVNWTAMPLSTYWAGSFAIISNETNATNIFVGTYSGVYLSTDNGTNWTHLNIGEQRSVWTFTTSTNEMGNMNLFAGTFLGGVFLSTNNGINWTAVNSGLQYDNNWIYSLEVLDPYIFASTGNPNGGIWRRPLSEMVTSVEDTSTTLPTQFRLYQNYPNPFNPSTRIKYSVAQSSKVVLKIYDVLGKEVATLINEERPIGNYEIEFDASNLSSGVYLYKLHAGNFVEMKKMILLR
ncbi:MAG: T9SS type A sorting domain-containing protein [Ignavibacterium sp.]|jgi:photosystem II stability/assembly factor-like uncharacterized protein|nr:T9SS type A sorting domain-containing protein [Ignavibacterium sp.]